MPPSQRQYFKELRLQQFRSLVALSRWQTFSAAATALKITRASVWQQIRSLEQELACTLLHTRAQRVELTAAGRRLVEISAPLLAGFDSVKTALHEAIADDLPHTLVIASAPSFIVHELREPITRIRTLFPNLHLRLIERNSAAAIDLLDQGGADLAVAARPDTERPRTTLEYDQIAAYPFTLIAPPGHPLLARPRVTLRELVRYPLILSGQVTYCRQTFDRAISRADLLDQANIVIESNFPDMLFEYVRLGLGVAVTPLPAEVAPDVPMVAGVSLRSLAHLFGLEPIYCVRRKGQFEAAYSAQFRAFAKK